MDDDKRRRFALLRPRQDKGTKIDMSKSALILTGLTALFSASCAVAPEGEEAVSKASSAMVGEGNYLYFTCNATGWQPNDATRMIPLDNMGIDYSLDFEVTQPWMVSGQDNCAFLTTNALNGWGTQQTWTGGWVEGDAVTDRNHLVVATANVARLFEHSQFGVTYPTLGKYTVRLTNARSAFSITKAASTPTNTPPTVSIARPYYDGANYFVGHELSFSGAASDKEDGTIPTSKCVWTILDGTTSVYATTGLGGTYTLPASVSAPKTYTVRFAATDSNGATSTVERNVVLLPLTGDLPLGSTHSDASQETVVVYFTVPAADIGSYYHVDLASTPGPLGGFVVRGDRGGATNDFVDNDSGDGPNRMAWVNINHLAPQLEFKPWAAGEYTLVLHSVLQVANTWEQPVVAPKGMNAHYVLTKATTSQATSNGTSVYLVTEQFPATFNVDGVATSKSQYGFAKQQADYNAIFRTYEELLGANYTKYGSTVALTYPLDPGYSSCGDASNPIRLACITMAPKGPTAFAHELGHVFTQAYPYVYSFDWQGTGCNNVEAAPLYLIAYLSDPKGAGGYSDEKFWRYSLQSMNNAKRKNATFWHAHLVDDGFPLFYRNAAGGWTGLSTTLKSYSANYAGVQAGTDGYARAQDFYLRLANSIPDQSRRQAFMGQLARWGVPFAPSGAQVVDADNDGVVDILDSNDNDASINPYEEECVDTHCVVDGIDQNSNGYVDEGILRMTESVTLGLDNIAYGDRGTRRKLYIPAGKTVQIAVTSAKATQVAVYGANVAFADEGPLWWYQERYGYTAPIAQSNEVANTVLVFVAPTSSVYTFEFIGHASNDVNIGDPISYTTSIRSAAPRDKDVN